MENFDYDLQSVQEARNLARLGKIATDKLADYTEEQIDKILQNMVRVAEENAVMLAKMAVEETGFGKVEDKTYKNHMASTIVYNYIKDMKCSGIIHEDPVNKMMEVADPVGLIMGIVPSTNPTSTAIYKSMIAIKARNAIVFSPHPSALQCTLKAATLMRDAAVAAGAPENVIGCLSMPSMGATDELMKCKETSMIIATGGPGMVKAAYSAGKPALGVGAGNSPSYIERTADVAQSVKEILASKTFDNGMICASEQAVIVDECLANDFERIMKENNCYFLNKEETKKVSDYVINPQKQAVNSAVVGKPASWIAEQAGVKVPDKTKILIALLPDVGPEYPLSREKLSPVLAYFKVKDWHQGFEYAQKMLNLGGLGHSAVIHSTNNDLITLYGETMKVGRVISNSPSSQGAIGDIYNTNTPSLTLGCGSYGHNSTTSNVSSVNLINKKRIAKRRVNMQWFKVPPKIYFENDSIQYLQKMEGIERAFIVTDPTMVKLGNVDKVLYYLRKREKYCHSEIYSDVEPDPDVETIMRGVQAMRQFKPDVIIALGGGSAMDAAKGMWLFYEHPEATFDGLKLKFMDIRKRAYKFPRLGAKAQMVCIPTTSGTGSEVTSFSVVTDKKNGNIKYPLADYALTPGVAIIDPQFVMSLPKSATADTGLDVLTHALEAYVSVMASDYTDGLALQAIGMVFEYLPRAYKNGATDTVAREKMHNASCIAGMAFTNAFLGLNHSMAHKLGGDYHIPHGRANAILLPYVVEYNAQKPTKFATFPKYEKFIADEKYARIAQYIGKGGKTVQESVQNLVQAIRDLEREVGAPASIQECGIDEKLFFDNLQRLSENAHEDQCTTANPRYPLISEIAELYTKAYYGK